MAAGTTGATGKRTTRTGRIPETRSFQSGNTGALPRRVAGIGRTQPNRVPEKYRRFTAHVPPAGTIRNTGNQSVYLR